MRIRDLPGWPPAWVSAYVGADRLPAGEMGTLRHVEPDVSGTMILVIVDSRGARRAACCRCGASCERVVEVLRAHRGRPLVEVGGAEIPDG